MQHNPFTRAVMDAPVQPALNTSFSASLPFQALAQVSIARLLPPHQPQQTKHSFLNNIFLKLFHLTPLAAACVVNVGQCSARRAHMLPRPIATSRPSRCNDRCTPAAMLKQCLFLLVNLVKGALAKANIQDTKQHIKLQSL